MNKDQKVVEVADITDKFERAQAAFLTEFSGTTVESITKLRVKLTESGSDYKVVRNTLAKRAVEGTDYGHLAEHLVGTNAVAFSYTDAAATAKALTEYAKEEPKFSVKYGALGAKALSDADVKALADLPPREVLIGKVLGALNGVPSGLVGVLAAVPRSLVYTLSAVEAKKGSEA